MTIKFLRLFLTIFRKKTSYLKIISKNIFKWMQFLSLYEIRFKFKKFTERLAN